MVGVSFLLTFSYREQGAAEPAYTETVICEEPMLATIEKAVVVFGKPGTIQILFDPPLAPVPPEVYPGADPVKED